MSRRRWLIAAGIAVLLIVAGSAVWLWQSSSRAGSPEQAATAYLRALESGDPAAVEATGIEVSDDALSAFDGAAALIDDATVVSVDQNGSAATARVSFSLNGTSHEASVRLAQESGRWRPESTALGGMTATTTLGDTARISDTVEIDDAVLPASDRLALIPAAYTVRAAPSTLLSGEEDVEVLPGGEVDLDIDAALRPEATTAAQEQLDGLLATCTSSGEIAPEGCGIRIPWGTEFRSVAAVSYRIDAEPRIRLDASGFTSEGGVLVATVTGTALDGTARTTTYRTEDWSVRGDVAFAGGELVLTPW
jgi:hypothetical protein